MVVNRRSREESMSVMSEPLHRTSMGISLAMNVAMALVIVVSITVPERQTPGSRSCNGTPMVAKSVDLAQAGKVRYAADATKQAQPGNVIRRSASDTRTEPNLAMVSFIRCLSD
jgi:hypothetical protein